MVHARAVQRRQKATPSARVLGPCAFALAILLPVAATASPAPKAATEEHTAAAPPTGAVEQAPPPATSGTAEPPPAEPPSAEPPSAEPTGISEPAAPSDPPSGGAQDESPADATKPLPPAAAPPASPEPPPPANEATEDPLPAASTPAGPSLSASKPPRIDGTYVGLVAYGCVGLARVNVLETDGAFGGWGLYARVGQIVLPWLGVGLQGGGGVSYRSEGGARQTLRQGGLMAEFNFIPAPKRLDLSLRASFGFGGGAVREEGRTDRSGFGGALFGAAIRYEFFPGVAKYRPRRGGGFGLGPELGWIGATPAAAGRPMANTFFLGLSSSFYFGD